MPKVSGARLIMPNGTNIGVRIIDISLSGSGIGTDQRPEIGSHVTLGKIPGRVVRNLNRASRSSSPGCSTRTRSKRTQPHSKRRVAVCSAGRRLWPREAHPPACDPLQPPLTAQHRASARRSDGGRPHA